MPYVVKVYNGHPDHGGVLIRVHSKKELEARGNELLKKNYYRSGNPPKARVKTCPLCETDYTTSNGQQIYCNPCRKIKGYTTRSVPDGIDQIPEDL